MSQHSRQQVIGIDGSRMGEGQRTGTENYSNQIIRGLLATNVDWRWRLYLNDRHAPDELPPNEIEIRAIPAPRLWTHARLSREILTHRPDVLFVPSHVIPLVHPRSVVTIHDLGYLHVPEAHPPRQRRMLDLTTRWSAKVASHIIVPSARTRDDLVSFYRTPPGKISVVHHGVSEHFRHVDQEDVARVRRTYDIRRPYVLAVGTIQPRKNLAALAKAMTGLKSGHELVIAGKKGWMANEVLSSLVESGIGDHLRLPGYIPNADLPALYAGATLFVQPSHFEGFGMPVIEAMAAGTPVLSASGSSLTEVAGNAACFFDPADELSLRDSLVSILGSDDTRQYMRERGLARSARFTWEQTVKETRIILRRMLDS